MNFGCEDVYEIRSFLLLMQVKVGTWARKFMHMATSKAVLDFQIQGMGVTGGEVLRDQESWVHRFTFKSQITSPPYSLRITLLVNLNHMQCKCMSRRVNIYCHTGSITSP